MPYDADLKQQQVADRIDKTKTKREITRDLGDTAPSRFAFTRPAPQLRG